MSHIVKFEISGLAGRKEIYSEKLNRDINLFFGLNGSGKTSLLRVLHSAMTGEAGMLENVPFDQAEVTIYSLNYRKNFVRSIDKKKRDSTKISRREYRETIRVQRDLFGQEVAYLEEPKSRGRLFWETREEEPSDDLEPDELKNSSWGHIYLPTWRLYVGDESQGLPMRHFTSEFPEHDFDWDLLFAQKLESLWSRYTNDLLSQVKKIQEDGLEAILRSILSPPTKLVKKTKLDAKTAYDRVKAFLGHRGGSTKLIGSLEKFANHYKTNVPLRHVVEDINTVEQRIERAMSSRATLQALILKMFIGNKMMKFDDTGISAKTEDGRNIGLASLSSGEKHVLWIFIETLLAESNSLLIDEPELSLHVDWQRLLILAMNQLNPNTQLILATHSPEILAGVADSKIFRL